MGKYFRGIENAASEFTHLVIKYRWLTIILCLILAMLVASGTKYLEFATNYRIFFSKANPELQAFEELQNTYTKNDNFFFVLAPKSGNAFDKNTLQAIEEITDRSWKIPYAIRVDSVSNFQYTYAEEDDLIVEDLVKNSHQKSLEFLQARKKVALDEPLLRNQLINSDGSVTAINVVLQYPEKEITEIPEAVAVARKIKAEFEAQYPDIDIYLTGVSMLNNAFAETGELDGKNLIPLMFGIILFLVWLVMRSLTSTFTVFVVITLSTIMAMGFAGFIGIQLTPISMSAPIVILTLAVADSIHILISLRGFMREGMSKHEAIIEAVRVNFLAVSITSLTTIVGFLMLNFSDAPPYWHLGNMTAIGIAGAWLYSLLLIPALISLLPYKPKVVKEESLPLRFMDKLADFVIQYRKILFLSFSGLTLTIIAFIPTLQFNDQWVKYFDERIEFRVDSDKIQDHFGLYPIEFSVPAIGTGGISEPEYLENLERFAEFLRKQPQITHAYSLSDIMKRLNRNMHNDEDNYYSIPQDRDLSAQYLLLYELSLPYGLDLNDRINIDKSASRVTATAGRASSAETKAFFANVKAWQQKNWPEYMHTSPTSAAVMFTYISQRNFENMIKGTLLGIIAIALIMMATLRSIGLGLLSLIPNALPILATFGTWALLVGEVGFSIATVASISLGIVVDDTVHFLSKYLRGRIERDLSREDAIRYSFHSVGVAIFVNTIILAAGFLVMTTSAFKLNVDLGLMTFLSIVFALILDFLFLPSLLLMGRSKEKSSEETTLPQTA